MPESLYFLAVLPPPSTAEEITAFKHVIADRYGSIHALKSPPHITLIPPFWKHDADMHHLVNDLIVWSLTKRCFDLELLNFDCFKPRVIYVDIVKNRDLESLQKALSEHLKEKWEINSKVRNAFHPHMTIAFRDLEPKAFYQAWDYFKHRSYQARFHCNALYLLKHFRGKWVVQHKFMLLGHKQIIEPS
ncbi:MAG: 2'-5' RNA ligase family protein [Saprospiraceae bacterium]|nr:2'-5' RNA ligase family protein [Saprospiraceae bacterium]